MARYVYRYILPAPAPGTRISISLIRRVGRVLARKKPVGTSRCLGPEPFSRFLRKCGINIRSTALVIVTAAYGTFCWLLFSSVYVIFYELMALGLGAGGQHPASSIQYPGWLLFMLSKVESQASPAISLFDLPFRIHFIELLILSLTWALLAHGGHGGPWRNFDLEEPFCHSLARSLLSLALAGSFICGYYAVPRPGSFAHITFYCSRYSLINIFAGPSRPGILPICLITSGEVISGQIPGFPF